MSGGSSAHPTARKSMSFDFILSNIFIFTQKIKFDLYIFLNAFLCSALVTATRIASGEHSLSTTSGFEQFSDVELFVMHPNYDT
jgi:predicted metal-dependent peptidase